MFENYTKHHYDQSLEHFSPLTNLHTDITDNIHEKKSRVTIKQGAKTPYLEDYDTWNDADDETKRELHDYQKKKAVENIFSKMFPDVHRTTVSKV